MLPSIFAAGSKIAIKSSKHLFWKVFIVRSRTGNSQPRRRSNSGNKHRFLLTRGHRSLIIDSHTHGLKYNSSLGNSLSFDLDSVITKDMYDKTDIYGNNPVGEGCTLSWISDKTETWKNIANDETTNIYPSKLPNEDCIIPSLAEWTDISQNKIQHGVNALS